jgi:hypothetical protein
MIPFRRGAEEGRPAGRLPPAQSFALQGGVTPLARA